MPPSIAIYGNSLLLYSEWSNLAKTKPPVNIKTGGLVRLSSLVNLVIKAFSTNHLVADLLARIGY